jgi:threonine/homoserine/homoserine lactone efflux protein
MVDLLVFLGSAVVISLSGVMAPGPITAATLGAGARSRHAGAVVAVGHGVVEFPLMFAIMVGAGAVLKDATVQLVVALIGGIVLLWMGVMLLVSLRRADQGTPSASTTGDARSPLWIGIWLTAANPYFLLWWATVGLALATEAMSFGWWAFVLFAVLHWLCDLVWLEVLSVAAHAGSRLGGRKVWRGINLVCGLALAGFGVYFLVGVWL